MAAHLLGHLPNYPRAFAPPKPTKRVRLAPVERKPVEGACPICMEELDRGKLEWCKYGCGRNLHAKCLDEWRLKRPNKLGPVECVLCRTDWKGTKQVPVEAGDNTV